jgi:hypothetical protein
MRPWLLDASSWITGRWIDHLSSNCRDTPGSCGLGDFGAFEANLAEAIVLDHGADFLFPRWGAEIGMLCGGNHRGHRLSMLPQPSRGQLRRACVRATAGRMPIVQETVWAVRGRIWECVILALPIATRGAAVTRLLVALLFSPHPMFVDPFDLAEQREILITSEPLPIDRPK